MGKSKQQETSQHLEKFNSDSQRIQDNCNGFIETLMKDYIEYPSINVEFKFYHDTSPGNIKHRACIWWDGIDKQDGWVQYLSDPIDWYWWQDFIFEAKKDIPKYRGYLSSWVKGFNPDEQIEFNIQYQPPLAEQELKKFNYKQ